MSILRELRLGNRLFRIGGLLPTDSGLQTADWRMGVGCQPSRQAENLDGPTRGRQLGGRAGLEVGSIEGEGTGGGLLE